jgi:hypothetical protein
MGADKGKKAKLSEGEDNEHIDGDLVLSIEKLQEIQDELEKVNTVSLSLPLSLSLSNRFHEVNLCSTCTEPRLALCT